jgi:hypothetical protein
MAQTIHTLEIARGGDIVAKAITVPGGVLDPAFVGADVYIGTPKSGDPGDWLAGRTAQKYIEYLHDGRYAELASLFTDDAIFLDPLRRGVNGPSEVRAFYEKTVGPMRIEIIGVSYIGSGNECMVELAIKVKIEDQERYILSSIDHFTVNAAGKITRMIVYLRPPQAGMTLRGNP